MVKKGWLRIVESIIAIMIVFGVLLAVLIEKKAQNQENSCGLIPELLNEIAKNQSLRQEIVIGEVSGTNIFLKTRITNPALSYRVKICQLEELCALEEAGLEKKNICANERIISTGGGSYQPKKLKLFLIYTQ